MGCSDVGAGENGNDFVRPVGMAHGHSDGGARKSCSASAYGVDDHHQRALLGSHCRVNIAGCTELFDAELRELFAHRFDKKFRIRHEIL